MRWTAAALGPITSTLLVLTSCASATVPAQRASSGSVTPGTTLPAQQPASQSQAQSRPTRAPAAAVGPVVAPLSELVELDLGSRVGPYPARSAAWIPGQPIAVNHDFDFGIALAMEDGLGAGIAAAKRTSKNAALAERLAKLVPIDAQALLRQHCSASPAACTNLANARVRVYGLLYGERAARLRVLLERVDAGAAAPIYVSISDPLALDDLAQPGVLGGVFSAEIARVLALTEVPAEVTSAESGRCAAGDNTTIAGRVIARDGRRVVLAATDPPPARVSCAADSFTRSN